MFETNAGDVISVMGQIMWILGPIYAFFFGLMAFRLLINKAAKKLFPKPKKQVKKKAAKRPRTAIRYERKKYPGLRVNYHKDGFTVSYLEDVVKNQTKNLRRVK